jgi:hypothetical protein
MTSFFKPWLLLVCLAASQLTQAQEVGKHALDYTYAEGSPEYWRNTHSTRPGNFVFRRDPNIWVYTPEIAKRVGMPLEWASDELKGVAAAAFRMERDGAEEDCGWGGNPKACKPVVRCVLELYFDRQTQQLPWAKDSLIVDVARGSDGSSGQHFSPVGRFSKDDPMPRMGLTRQPFADPQTGEELMWNTRVLAYDKEIHGRYAFVKLDLGCQGQIGSEPNTKRIFRLETKKDRDARNERQINQPITDSKTFYEVLLPASWDKRVAILRQENWQRDNDFYKNIWNNINQGDKK